MASHSTGPPRQQGFCENCFIHFKTVKTIIFGGKLDILNAVKRARLETL